MNSFPWPLFPFLFIGMWLGIGLILSRLGWSDLAHDYRAEHPFEGRRWHFVSAKVGKVSWGSSLTIGVNGEGLFLAPQILFRFVHPALFIPWSDIGAGWRRSFGFQLVQLTASRAPDVAIVVPESLARAMALEAGAAWPAPDLLAEIELRRATVVRGRTAMAYAAIAVLVFSSVAIGIGSLNVPEYAKLDRSGQAAPARVTSVEPENHNTLRYTYTVAGAQYTGVGSIPEAAGRAPIRPGAPLTIHYLPADPTLSCLGDPHDLLVNEVEGAGLAAAFATIALMFVLRRAGFAIRRSSDGSDPRLGPDGG